MLSLVSKNIAFSPGRKVVKSVDMAAKKRGRGRPPNPDRRPRKPIQLPDAWADLAKELANKRRQPTVWLLLELLAELAKKEGLKPPKAPWEM
jgi:hypothetical protein